MADLTKPEDPSQAGPPHSNRHHIYAAEATGLLIIAVVLLVITLIRYWENISWSLH